MLRILGTECDFELTTVTATSKLNAKLISCLLKIQKSVLRSLIRYLAWCAGYMKLSSFTQEYLNHITMRNLWLVSIREMSWADEMINIKKLNIASKLKTRITYYCSFFPERLLKNYTCAHLFSKQVPNAYAGELPI